MRCRKCGRWSWNPGRRSAWTISLEGREPEVPGCSAESRDLRRKIRGRVRRFMSCLAQPCREQSIQHDFIGLSGISLIRQEGRPRRRDALIRILPGPGESVRGVCSLVQMLMQAYVAVHACRRILLVRYGAAAERRTDRR